MTGEQRRSSVFERVDERPTIRPEKARKIPVKELLYRFLAGAATSVAAGGASLAFGARAGGILLAFPAILAASLTLIEDEESSAEATEDARGAIVGALALAAFAAVAALALGHLSGPVALLLASLTWLALALGTYRLAWWK